MLFSHCQVGPAAYWATLATVVLPAGNMLAWLGLQERAGHGLLLGTLVCCTRLPSDEPTRVITYPNLTTYWSQKSSTDGLELTFSTLLWLFFFALYPVRSPRRPSFCILKLILSFHLPRLSARQSTFKQSTLQPSKSVTILRSLAYEAPTREIPPHRLTTRLLSSVSSTLISGSSADCICPPTYASPEGGFPQFNLAQSSSRSKFKAPLPPGSGSEWRPIPRTCCFRSRTRWSLDIRWNNETRPRLPQI